MRLIDADEVMKTINHSDVCVCYTHQMSAGEIIEHAIDATKLCVKTDIEQLPTIDPVKHKWIPVSERLPEECAEVLVCDKDGDMQVADYCYSTELEGAVIWFTRGKCFEEIVAWMPLPEPYKEER